MTDEPEDTDLIGERYIHMADDRGKVPVELRAPRGTELPDWYDPRIDRVRWTD